MKIFLLELFSFLLIPWYLYCTAWIGRELFALSGLTFWEFIQKGQGRVPMSTSHHRSRSRRNRAVLALLMETSSDPEETRRLFRRYCYSTLPGFLAFVPSLIPGLWGNWWMFLGWDVILFLAGWIIKAQGKGYREKHRRDPLEEERRESRQRRENRTFFTGKSLVVYGLFGLFFLGMFVVIATGGGQVFQLHGSIQWDDPPTSPLNVAPDFYDVHAAVTEAGFETANIPTTYWRYEEKKLGNVVSGIKGEAAFEFYEYSDDETVDLVYNQICYDIDPEVASQQREEWSQSLPNGGERCTLTRDGVTYDVLYWGNTVVYAYAPEGSKEITDLLVELNYIRPQ